MSISTQTQSRDIFGATLLVTGCCIGAGMIGLPVLSALAGFIPSVLAMMVCYFFTTITGLLLLEVTLWFDHKVNLISMVGLTIGKKGKIITFTLFLFLFYCIFVAYMEGGGTLLTNGINTLFHHDFPRQIGIIASTIMVAALTFVGTAAVDNINRVLMVGLVASYCILVMLGLPKVNMANFKIMHFGATLTIVPILLICFGYQNLVPSLTHYLKRNVQATRIAIIIGNLLPLFVYAIWNFVILGMLPGHYQNMQDSMVTEMLQNSSQYVSVLFVLNAFSLFAILTSFLPSAISFIDFLEDSIQISIKNNRVKNLLIYSAVFLPPLLCALSYPHIFLQALNFAGGFIDVLLFGVLPAIMILQGRYHKKISGPYQVFGGALTPILILLSSLFFLGLKIT